MEWEQMLEEYLAMLESFAGAWMFQRQAAGDAADGIAVPAPGGWFPDGEAALPLPEMGGAEGAPQAADQAGWMESAGEMALAAFPEADTAALAAWQAAGKAVLANGGGLNAAGNMALGGAVPLESWWAETEAGGMEAEYAAAGAAPVLPAGTAYPPEERERVLAALEQAMPEADGMVFRPAGPPGWEGEAGNVFLWQRAAERRAEKAETSGDGRRVLFEGEKPEAPAVGREADGMADRLLDALEARLMLEIGSGAEGFYR